MRRAPLVLAGAASVALAALAIPSWWSEVRATRQEDENSYSMTFSAWSDRPESFTVIVPVLAVALLAAAVLVGLRRDSARRAAAVRGFGGIAVVGGLALPWFSLEGLTQSGFALLFGADVALAALGVAIAVVPRVPAAVALTALAVTLWCGVSEYVGAGVVVSAVGAAAAAAASARDPRRNAIALAACVLFVALCAARGTPDWLDVLDGPRDLPPALPLAVVGAVLAVPAVALLRRRAPTAPAG